MVLLTALVSRPDRAPRRYSILQLAHPALIPKLAPTLRKKIAHQSEVICQEFLADLGHVPTWQEGMNPIHERRVVAHLRRHRAEQMPDPLLVLNVHLEIADQNDAAIGTDVLLAATELARLHVSLHDVHPVLLVERYSRHLIEADDIVLAHKPTLTIGVVDKHLRHRCLAAGDEMGVW